MAEPRYNTVKPKMTIKAITRYFNIKHKNELPQSITVDFMKSYLAEAGRKPDIKGYYSHVGDFLTRNAHDIKTKFAQSLEEKRSSRLKRPTYQQEDDYEIPQIPNHYLPSGYYKGISPESIECLDKDEIDYSRKHYWENNESLNLLVDTKVSQVLNESGLFHDNRNSDGQEVPETGKYSENVYLKDCPFMLGKDQVEFFKIMQEEKERHTIKDVDDFITSAKKENKKIL